MVHKRYHHRLHGARISYYNNMTDRYPAIASDIRASLRVQRAFIAVAIAMGVVSLFNLYAFCKDRNRFSGCLCVINRLRATSSNSDDVHDVKSPLVEENDKPGWKIFFFRLFKECGSFPLILIAMMMFCFDGLINTWNELIYTYSIESIENIGLKSNAAYIESTFWGSYALASILAIPTSYFALAPASFVFFAIIGVSTSSVLLLMFHQNIWVVIPVVSLAGISVAAVLPSLISLAEQLVHLTAWQTTVLVIFAAAGEMTIPVLVSYAIEHVDPWAFTVASITLAVFATLLFFSVCTLARRQMKQMGARFWFSSPLAGSICETRCAFPRGNDGLDTMTLLDDQKDEQGNYGTVENKR